MYYSTITYEVQWYIITIYITGHTLLRGHAALSLLADERLVDVGDHTTAGDGGLDQSVQLLVSPDGQLEMSGCDPLHLEILTGVAGQLEDLGSEVLQDGRAVHGSSGSNSSRAEAPALQMTVNPANTFVRTEK